MAYRREKTRVYHAVGAEMRFDEQVPSQVQLVAEVDTDDLDEAFKLTNDTGYEECQVDDRVTIFVIPHRSTSVGDVIVLPDGEGYLVLRHGFRRIGSLFAGAVLSH